MIGQKLELALLLPPELLLPCDDRPPPPQLGGHSALGSQHFHVPFGQQIVLLGAHWGFVALLQTTFTELAALLLCPPEEFPEEFAADEFAAEELLVEEPAWELRLEELAAEEFAAEELLVEEPAWELPLEEFTAELLPWEFPVELPLEEETALAAEEERGALEEAGALEDRAEEDAQGHVSVKPTLKSSMPLMGSTTTLIVCEPADTLDGPQFHGSLQYCVKLVCHVLGETVK
jgi:hypothetical protein